MELATQSIETLVQELRNSEVRYRRLFEAAQDGILILDAVTGEITAANPFLLDMLGYSQEELMGKQLWEIGLFKDRKLAGAAFDKLQSEGYIRYEDLPLESKDGRRHDVEFVSNLYDVVDKKVIQCNIRDITDRKLLETKIQQAQKMEAVGQLAGGVAHDYNNILTSTLLQLSLLLEDPSLSTSTRGTIQQLEVEAKRAAVLTRQLLLFSRRQALQLKPINLTAVLTNLVKMLQRLLSKDVHLDFRAAEYPLWVEADAGMIEQVVTNLCLNAQDAMGPKGGRLAVEARLVELASDPPHQNTGARPGRFVRLSVTDSGCGIEPAALEHIFEPFFTTKGPGKGTGLGLSTVFGIAKQHRGWVEVASQLGKGATFRVFLPALAEIPVVVPPEAPASEVPIGEETVLLVDDEKTIRDMVALALKRFGYRVLQARNGEEALQVWKDHEQEIDLLFTDMKMPGGMDGLELFERLKRTKPELKGIVSSGYTDRILNVPECIPLGITLLPKPYDVKTLASTVRACLNCVRQRHEFDPLLST
jgi:PAS domain S-box-containing protein